MTANAMASGPTSKSGTGMELWTTFRPAKSGRRAAGSSLIRFYGFPTH